MGTAGIIAEYNPFHNGHKYLIDEARRTHGAVISVMSGHFTQRGGIAVTDKWTRARAAILCGCDLVLELPVCFSLSSAPDFAYGAAALLDRLNVVDTLYFGAEDANTEYLTQAANALISEPPDISERVRSYLSAGLSYPAAYAKAWDGKIQPEILIKPNNILALEYIKALIRLDSTIKPAAVGRLGAVHDGAPVGAAASSSYIRGMISRGLDYSGYVPKAAYSLYKVSDMTYDISRLDGFITAALRVCSARSISPYVPEGLENRIKNAAAVNFGFDDICAAVKSKRYTLSRIRRAVLAFALALPVDPTPPHYARVLALNDTGKALLREIREKSDIEIITKTAAYNKPDELLSADIRATDIFSLCAGDKSRRTGGLDYTVTPAVL